MLRLRTQEFFTKDSWSSCAWSKYCRLTVTAAFKASSEFARLWENPMWPPIYYWFRKLELTKRLVLKSISSFVWLALLITKMTALTKRELITIYFYFFNLLSFLELTFFSWAYCMQQFDITNEITMLLGVEWLICFSWAINLLNFFLFFISKTQKCLKLSKKKK